MDRRHFLKVSSSASIATVLGTTLATLNGCGGSSAPPNIPTVVPPVTPVSTGPDWLALSKQIQGSLIRPSDALYEQARLVINTRFDAIMPQAIARCASATDVSAVLDLVRKNGLAVTPRSGGHSFAGYSTGTGVVIDVTPMNTISISEGTATIGAGARLVDIYDQLAAHGVAIPTGSCESVGIAGITLGGGWGVVGRAYGLTCDALISAQVVTADGKIVTCDAVTEPDLFWALRGGGGGNFGVVTSFTFKTHITRDLCTFNAIFKIEDAVAVMRAWQAWQATLPDMIWASVVINSANINAPPVVTLFGVCVGSESDFSPYWQTLLLSIQVQPQSSSVSRASYRDTMLASCYGRSVSQCHIRGQTPDASMERYAQASTSDLFDALIPEVGLNTLVNAIVQGHAQGFGGYMIFNLMGGAIARIAPEATAFVHRHSLISAEYDIEYQGGTADAKVDKALNWVHGMRAIMKPWSSGRAYVNYVDPLLDDWKNAYYGSNYARLVQVKMKYDPSQVFNFGQGIPTK